MGDYGTDLTVVTITFTFIPVVVSEGGHGSVTTFVYVLVVPGRRRPRGRDRYVYVGRYDGTDTRVHSLVPTVTVVGLLHETNREE